MLRTRMIAGLALCVGIALAGCGGSDPDNQVASLTGGTSTTVKAKSQSSEQDQRDALLSYTRCLRKEGIEVDDPTFSSGGPSGGPDTAADDDSGPGSGEGSVAVIGTPGGSVKLHDVDSPAFKAADKKCKPILDAVREDMPEPSAKEKAEAQDRALAYAKCMREHGVDMKDPTFTEDGGVQIQVPAEGQVQVKGDDSNPDTGSGPSKKVQDAMDACEKTNPLQKDSGSPGEVSSSSGEKDS